MLYISGPGFGDSGRVISGPDMAVSRKHLEIEVSYAKVYLKDCDSTNGTFLNGRSIDEIEIKEPGKHLLRLGESFTLELIAGE